MKLRRDSERLETKRFVQRIPQTKLANVSPGATVYGLVLGSTREDTTVIDLGSGALVRWRIPWPEGVESDLRLFGVVEAVIADDPADDPDGDQRACTPIAAHRSAKTESHVRAVNCRAMSASRRASVASSASSTIRSSNAAASNGDTY